MEAKRSCGERIWGPETRREFFKVTQFVNSWTGSGTKVSWLFLPKPFPSWQVAFLCNISEVFHSEEQHLKWSKVTQTCPSLCNPMDCMLATRILHSWDFPGKSTGAGCHFLLQGILPTQGLNSDLLHCRQMLYCLSHQWSPHLKAHAIKWRRCIRKAKC